jgi:peptidoglycan/xylan/chitin deacetylase (PgdA/CDA1 family)/competence protein ComGC
MVKSRFPCKYHPEKLSLKKCFFCKEYICSGCQHQFAHHIFCGNGCIIKYVAKNYLNIFSKIFKTKKRKEWLLVVIILVILQFIFYLIFYNKVENLHDQVARLQEKGVKAEFMQFDSSELAFTLDTSYTPALNYLNISGKAKNNALVGLWQNGKFVQSQIVDNGFYKFSPQALSLGKNQFALWSLVHEQAILIDSLSLEYRSYRLELLAKSVYHINTPDRVIAITFDAGSHSFGADSIIQILQEKEIKSTFFLTGSFIKEHQLIVKKIIDQGHELANHTYTHPHLTSLEKNGLQHTLAHVNRKYIHHQLNNTDSIFYAYFNLHLKPYWRAPFGELNNEILAWAAELGYRHIHWSSGCDTWDWVSDEESPFYRTSEEIYAQLIDLEMTGKLKGSIVLMHLATDRKYDFPFQILAKLIDDLKVKGYQFLTISQLLSLHLKTQIKGQDTGNH